MECFNCGQDGHLAWQCQWKDSAGERMPAQLWRCHQCQSIIYRWDQAVPCEHHRLAAVWRGYYHSAQFITDCAATRIRLAESRPVSDDRSRRIAALQVAESRAVRDVI